MPERDEREGPPVGPAAGGAARGEARRPRVLLADDDRSFRTSMALVLKLHGLEVDCARDGAETVRLAAARAYDGFVLDLRMPGIGGLGALGAIRRASSAPVVVVTGFATGEVAERARAGGAAAVLDKPVDPARLVAALGLGSPDPGPR